MAWRSPDCPKNWPLSDAFEEGQPVPLRQLAKERKRLTEFTATLEKIRGQLERLN